MDLGLRPVNRTIETYNATAQDYAEKTAGLIQTERLEEFLRHVGKRSGSVIDLGCGPGRDANYFYNHGFRVVGVDLSLKLLEMARGRVPGGFFFNLDITNSMSWMWPNKFVGAWASASYVHVPEHKLLASFNDVNKMLSNQGIFYVRVMEGEGNETCVSKRYGDAPQGEKFWQYFSEEMLAKTLFSSGFDVLNVYRQDNEFSSEHPWMDFFARKK